MHGFLGLYRALLSLISRKQVDAWFIHCFLEASSVLQTPSHMSQNPPLLSLQLAFQTPALHLPTDTIDLEQVGHRENKPHFTFSEDTKGFKFPILPMAWTSKALCPCFTYLIFFKQNEI